MSPLTRNLMSPPTKEDDPGSGTEPPHLRALEEENERLRERCKECERAEADLRQSEQRYRDMFEKNRAVKLLIDPDDGRIQDANSAACVFYGYPPEEITGLRIWDINTLGEEETRRRMQAARRGEMVDFEFEHRLASGEIRKVLVHSGPVSIEERTLLHSIIFDITERDRLQTLLLHAQKLEALGRMAGGVAHDFNNTLSAVLGCGQLALLDLDEEHPVHGLVVEICQAARQAARTTRSLLTYARRQAVAPEVFDPNQRVEELLGMLRRLLGEDVELRWFPGEDVGSLEMDPTQLHQLLMNLCINARDAISGVGVLEIETAGVPAGAPLGLADSHPGEDGGDTPTGHVMLRVTDDGCGMDEATRARVFDPFFTTKEPDVGTGLGLAIVHGIVLQNRGRLAIESAPGEGTTVRVYLPRHAGEPAEEPRKSRTIPPQSRGETVLLLEDEEIIRAVTDKLLGKLGYRVLTARDPEEAIGLAQEQGPHIDLLLTDVIMPGMNGQRLARLLQPHCPGARILYMSGYPTEVLERRGELDAAEPFLAKPFDLETLGTAVRQALGDEDS